jgi:K+ transporter
METSFIIGREKLRPRQRRTAFWHWRDRLFIVMTDATEFFRIPLNRVVELGGQIEIRVRIGSRRRRDPPGELYIFLM